MRRREKGIKLAFSVFSWWNVSLGLRVAVGLCIPSSMPGAQRGWEAPDAGKHLCAKPGGGCWRKVEVPTHLWKATWGVSGAQMSDGVLAWTLISSPAPKYKTKDKMCKLDILKCRKRNCSSAEQCLHHTPDRTACKLVAQKCTNSRHVRPIASWTRLSCPV